MDPQLSKTACHSQVYVGSCLRIGKTRGIQQETGVFLQFDGVQSLLRVFKNTILAAPLKTALYGQAQVNQRIIRNLRATAVSSRIMELDEEGPFGEPRLLLANSQCIFLDLFQRRDGREGLIRWPHVSINMMEKIAPPPDTMGL